MVLLHLSVGLNLSFTCVQDGCELILEGQQVMNANPVLKCPKCGLRIRVGSRPQAPAGPQPPGRFPQLKPKQVG